MAEIPCLPLRQVTDGPLFSAGPGTLSSLTNMELQPGGYAECRGGLEELKPSGGTAADAISTGGYSDAHQMSTSYGWVRTFDSAAGAGSQYSKNLQLDPGAWEPFATPVTNDAVYYGSDAPFSRIAVSLATVGNWATGTFAYEYWNGSAWTALTTAETIDWELGGVQDQKASWAAPSDWVANTVGDAGTGNILKYWMRIRMTGVTGLVTNVTVSTTRGFWVGMRELYVASIDPRTSATSGLVRRHGQTGTTEEWFTVGTSLYAGAASPYRMVSYRGRLYFVNGKEQKRWDGANFRDIGLPASGATAVIVVNVAAGLGAGIWRYYMAFGYGPITNLSLAHPLDSMSLYGPGQATYLGEATTTAGNETVTLTLTATVPPDAGAYYIYRTQDLTNVPAAQRPTFPAFLLDSFGRNGPGTTMATAFIGLDAYNDTTTATVFPQTEAYTYDIAPPTECRYLTVYQNRLFLADSETIYWSDPFKPDSFSTKSTTGYIRLARAVGGRNMGIIEFADQVVAFTEDQTWGITNVDLDAPHLYPIALGVGCVAPDSVAVVEGRLMWMARDGIYSWDGNVNAAPKKVSGKMEVAFGKLSYENHGGSRAVGHDRRYDLRLSNPIYSGGLAYRYNLDSEEWSVLFYNMASTLFPLTTIYAPLGNNDEGAIHPLWGKCQYDAGGSEFSLFLGELTTQDHGTNFNFSAIMHFPVRPGELFTPYRVMAYYQASNGWGTPSLAFSPTTVIGSSVGTLNTGTPDTAEDYSVIGATFSQVGRGSSDLRVAFTGTTVAGGTVNGQRLFGALLEGKPSKIRRGGV